MSFDNTVAKVATILLRVRLKTVGTKTGLSVPPGVTRGGLSLAHLGSTVVNNQAHIGQFCRLHTSTNIGIYQGKAPTIGDFVYVGPGAVLFGGITVGDRAVIGANAVVNRDVPAGVTVAGSPARVISRSDSFDVMPPWIQSLMNDGPVLDQTDSVRQ